MRLQSVVYRCRFAALRRGDPALVRDRVRHVRRMLLRFGALRAEAVAAEAAPDVDVSDVNSEDEDEEEVMARFGMQQASFHPAKLTACLGTCMGAVMCCPSAGSGQQAPLQLSCAFKPSCRVWHLSGRRGATRSCRMCCRPGTLLSWSGGCCWRAARGRRRRVRSLVGRRR